MISFPMPFASVPCKIWLAHESEEDEWGNREITYGEQPDIETRCVYAPGRQRPETADDIEEGRPEGARVAMTFYLPKEVDADLRGALSACQPQSDLALCAMRFKVVGQPFSYQRENTPGDYSWCVEGVAYLG